MSKTVNIRHPIPARRIRLTDRDQEVVETLAHYQLLREGTLHALCFPTIKEQRNVQYKLKRLVEHGYIGRRFPPIFQRNREHVEVGQQNRHAVAYFLERAGAELLGCEYTPAIRDLKLYGLNHRLDIGDVHACLELALKQVGHIALVLWLNEHDKDETGKFFFHERVALTDPETKKKRTLPLVPDACFLLRDTQTGKEACFFLEVDEGTESGRKRWREKVLAYCAYYDQGDFGRKVRFEGDGFRVLVVNSSQTGKEQAKRKENLIRVTHEAGGGRDFWLTTFDQMMPQGKVTGEHILASSIWKRANREEKRELALVDRLFGKNLS